MPTLRVPLGARSYDVVIAPGALAWLGRLAAKAVRGRKAMIVADTTVSRLYGRAAIDSLAAAGFTGTLSTIPPGEFVKSTRGAEHLWTEMAEMGADREAVVVALGGGVVGDLAGFVASTWMRGVALIHVPTTLLAQVDASVGGKTGVNLADGKNLVGTFYQPKAVVADLNTLDTLPDREFRAGLAEVVKYGLIGDRGLFQLLEKESANLRDPRLLAKIVPACVRQKARIVAEDEREAGKRMLLNLGHTFGHAIEAATKYRKYHHGEAVAIGLCAAAVLAERAGLSKERGLADRVRALVRACGLPDRAPGIPAATLQKFAGLDKKSKGGAATYVLCDSVGRAGIYPDLPADAVRFAWENISKK